MAYDDILKKLMGKSSEEIKQESYEKTKANVIDQRYNESKSSKEVVKEKWIDYVKLWRGDHWSKNRAKWKSDTVENLCFSVVETMIPLMGDRSPEINYLPQTEEDITAAEQLNQVSRYIWNADNMPEKMPIILRDMLIIGTAIVKMRWDVEKYNGMGDVTADIIDPFHFFPNPEATGPDDMQWCILKTKIPTKELLKQYGKEVPSDAEYNADDHKRPSDTNDNNGNFSPTSATVLEYWEKNKNGRMEVTIYSNGVILEEKESPYETDEFPFIFFYDHKLNHEFWGIGEFENLKPLQLELNKVRAMIMDNMIANNNTILVVDSTSGVSAKELSNKPGLVVEKQPGGKIERLAPGHLPSHFQNQIEITKQAMQEVSGVHDVSKGMVGGQVTAASAIQILTENSQTRLRGKLRNVEGSVKRMAYWYLTLIRQFYTEPRIVRLTGDDNSFQFIPFDALQLRQEQPIIDPETGQPEMDEITGEPKTEILLTEFDIKISSGSSMMMNKSAKYQQVLELYQSGAVDLETLLQSADIGNPKEIIKKMIDYGVIKDPNAPQLDISQILGDLGIKVNVTSNNPEAVMSAIQNAQQQIQQIEQQAGGQIGADMNQQLQNAQKMTRGEM